MGVGVILTRYVIISKQGVVMATRKDKKTRLEKDYLRYFKHLRDLQDSTKHVSLRQLPFGDIVPSVATGAAFEEPIRTP
jgi:hypothetical protein